MIALAINPNRSPQMVQEWMDRAENAVRDSPDRAARAAVHATRLALMSRANDPAVWEIADRLPRDDPDLGVLRHSVRALLNVGIHDLLIGHDERAATLLHESLDLAPRPDINPFDEYYSASPLLRLDWEAGRWERLEADLAALLTQAPDTTVIRIEASLIRGCLAAARGQWTSALDHLRHGAHLAESIADPADTGRAAVGITRVHVARGQQQDAWAVILPALTRHAVPPPGPGPPTC